MENGGGGSEGGGRKSEVRESARDETAAQVWQRDLYSGAGLTTQISHFLMHRKRLTMDSCVALEDFDDFFDRVDHSRSRSRASYCFAAPAAHPSGFGHVAPFPTGSILAALPSTRAAPARACSNSC